MIEEAALENEFVNVSSALEKRGLLLDSLARVTKSLAVVLTNKQTHAPVQGKREEAEPLYERATMVWETALGPDHPNVASALNNRALLLDLQVSRIKGRPRKTPALHACMLVRGSLSSLLVDTTLSPPDPLFSLPPGKCAEVEPLLKRSLAVREHVCAGSGVREYCRIDLHNGLLMKYCSTFYLHPWPT